MSVVNEYRERVGLNLRNSNNEMEVDREDVLLALPNMPSNAQLATFTQSLEPASQASDDSGGEEEEPGRRMI